MSKTLKEIVLTSALAGAVLFGGGCATLLLKQAWSLTRR